MKVQLVTPYHISLLQRYGVTVRGNVTSVYPPLVGRIKSLVKLQFVWTHAIRQTEYYRITKTFGLKTRLLSKWASINCSS